MTHALPYMAILAYGINYRTAPIDVRERVAFPEDALWAALVDAKNTIPSVSEAAIISTCNRTELVLAIDPAQETSVPQWLAGYRPVGIGELTSMAYSHWDQEAAQHLIRVAAGLDSQVLGEPQILGQVKTAYDTARSAGHAGTRAEPAVAANIERRQARALRYGHRP